MVEPTNELKAAQVALKVEEQRIYRDLTLLVRKALPAITHALDAAAQVMSSSKAFLAVSRFFQWSLDCSMCCHSFCCGACYCCRCCCCCALPSPCANLTLTKTP